MFNALSVPFGCVMMYNVVKLKDGVSEEDVQLALGEMCNVVKNTYGDEKGGFIAGRFINSADLFRTRVPSPPNNKPKTTLRS